MMTMMIIPKAELGTTARESSVDAHRPGPHSE